MSNMPAVIPYLLYADAAKAIAFLCASATEEAP
jgi:hypothetical protein